MGRYDISFRAKQDIIGIDQHTVRYFGLEQADKYISGLYDRFALLAESPELGRDVSWLRAGYFRFEYESHSIFYKQKNGSISIIRILHARMDMVQHL